MTKQANNKNEEHTFVETVEEEIVTHKPQLLIAGAVMLVLALTAMLSIGFIGDDQDGEQVQVISICNEITYRDAAKYYKNSNNTKALELAQQIEAEGAFDSDPSCLLVVTIGYLNGGDLETAKAYNEQLANIYDPEVGYNDRLGLTLGAKTPEEIQKSIEFSESPTVQSEYLDGARKDSQN